MLRLAAIVPLAIWCATPQQLLAAEDCPYLTNVEVEEVTGRELLFDFTTAPLADGPGTVCDSSIVRVILLPGANAGSRWEAMIQGAGRGEEQRFPIAELGERAYALRLESRAENEYPTSVVVVTTDSHVLAISVRAENGKAADTAEPHAIELAKLAIPRVQEGDLGTQPAPRADPAISN